MITLNSQVIDVIKSGDMNTNSPTTKLSFKSSTNNNLSIHQVISEYYSYHYGYEANEGPQLCITPGEIEVSNGLYTFQADGNGGSVDFTVDAMGGTQYWKLYTGNSGEVTGGAVAGTLGLTAGIIGLTFYAVFPNNTYDNYGNVVSSTPNNWFLAMGIAGFAALIGGGVMIIDGMPSANLVKIKF
jgi:hypothetical protein